MQVALFVPCYVDQLRPRVGLASLDLLEAVGIDAICPEEPSCCGQPFLTAGERDRAAHLAARFVEAFDGFDAIVTPSGSCAATLRHHLALLVGGARAEAVARRTFELCELLVEHDLSARLVRPFPHRVGLHASCHALRELRLGTPSETREPARRDPARRLLEAVPALELVELERADECCGFGGVFSVIEEAVSARMGIDRLADHARAGADTIASSDLSCLLQLEGLARRRGVGLEMRHVAEILAESLAPPRDAAGDPTRPGPSEPRSTGGSPWAT